MIDLKWIDEKIEFLSKKNGFFKLRDNSNFFLEPENNILSLLKSGDIQKLNKALMIMANHLSLKSCPVIEDWYEQDFPLSIYGNEDESTNAPGVIYYSGLNHSKIKIDARLRFMTEILGAILAHELMHFYLFSNNIYYQDTEENEKFTDFATVYFGLGKFTIAGYEKVTWNWSKGDFVYTESYQVGYLSPNELILIMARISKLRFIKTDALITNFSKYQYEFSRLRDFADIIKISDYLSGLEKRSKVEKYLLKIKIQKAEKNERIIVRCPVCYNTMKILDINEMVKVNCKKCDAIFIYINESSCII